MVPFNQFGSEMKELPERNPFSIVVVKRFIVHPLPHSFPLVSICSVNWLVHALVHRFKDTLLRVRFEMHSSDDSAPKAAESLCHWSEGGYDNEFQVPFNWRVVGTSTDHLQPFADGSVWCSSQDKSHTWSRIFPLFRYKQKQQNKMDSQLLLLHGSNPNLVPLLVKRSPNSVVQ